MKRYIILLIILVLFVGFIAVDAFVEADLFEVIGITKLHRVDKKEIILSNTEAPPLSPYEKTIREDIFSLMLAYPDIIADIEVTDDALVYLMLKSGRKILYDDKTEKSEAVKLDNPDLQDMLEELYQLDPIDKLMPEDYNPGRVRVYPLLKEAYGGSQAEIEKNLTGVTINSRQYRFNENNSAAHHLKKAMTESSELAKEKGELWQYLTPINGTYKFRNISRTNRLSPHAFGIALDLASSKSDYWQWATREEGEKRLKSYPKELVKIMESNYFVWGGKWGQFDILHFEYRPEIIIKAQYFSNNNDSDLWFECLPHGDATINEIVSFIEERLPSAK
ncbi:MAG: M15 family metallopeptidase [Flavobacteriales bacterium]|nr:M15 family metallopeptidase [Flavobacteriales bacterium]